MLPWIQKFIKNKKIFVFSLAAVFLFFLFSFSLTVHAQNELNFGLQPVQNTIGLGGDDIRLIIARIIRAVLGLLGVVAIGIITYAGYTIMTSGGNEEKVTEGKRILKNAIIGLIIILSAFTIAQFIINSLARATGINNPLSSRRTQPEFFLGSGGLGRVVKDHYPFRDQRDVKRNTKLVVTFAEAVDPASLIENTNRTCWDDKFVGPTSTCLTTNGAPVNSGTDPADIANPYYGDCVISADFNWETSCDHLNVEAMKIFAATTTPDKVEDDSLVQAAVMTTYEDGANKNAYTFVFKPYNPQYLGSEVENVWYTVYLNNNIKKKLKTADGDSIGIFNGQFSNFYTWKFETGTSLDFDPPYVVDFYPFEASSPKDYVPRNTIIQLTFNEPVDPTAVQGYFSSSSSFTNIILDKTGLEGEWKITNGYRTVEFVSVFDCGVVNSCGEKMYCLPLDCADPKDPKCTNKYNGLVRTAELMNPGSNSFESLPFSGVMDLAGNALDSDDKRGHDNVVANPHNPAKPDNLKTIGTEENKPDNFWWNFIVENRIDRTAPYVEKLTPGLDEEDVKGLVPLNIYFDKRLWIRTLGEFILEEYPANYIYPGGQLDSIWFVPRASTVDNKTMADIWHREFGPNETDLYYFPVTPSAIKSITQNCLYPGRGPLFSTPSIPEKGDKPECYYQENDDGTVGTMRNCVPVEVTGGNRDTGCVQSSAPNNENWLVSDVNTCLQKLRDLSPLTNGGKVEQL